MPLLFPGSSGMPKNLELTDFLSAVTLNNVTPFLCGGDAIGQKLGKQMAFCYDIRDALIGGTLDMGVFYSHNQSPCKE